MFQKNQITGLNLVSKQAVNQSMSHLWQYLLLMKHRSVQKAGDKISNNTETQSLPMEKYDKENRCKWKRDGTKKRS